MGKRKEGVLKELDQAAKDPNKKLANSLSNFSKQYDQNELNMAKLCERNPDFPGCIGVDSYEKVLKRMCKKYPDDKELLKKLQEMGWSDEFQ